MYAATTKDEGNAADGRFSAVCQLMIKGTQRIRIPNPHLTDIGVSLVKEILRQAGLSTRDWDKA